MSNMEKKTYRMAFRCSKKEAEFLKQVAGEEGRPVGNLIRNWLLLHKLEELSMTPAEIKVMKEMIEESVLAEISKKKKKKGHEKKVA